MELPDATGRIGPDVELILLGTWLFLHGGCDSPDSL